MAHPIIVIDVKGNDFNDNLDGARIYLLFAIVVHFGECISKTLCERTSFLSFSISVTISVGFVHRDDSIWRKNPFSNVPWVVVSSCM